MAGLTLDAGALIAADRGDRRFWAYWKEAERRDLDVTVPTPVVAGVARASQRSNGEATRELRGGGLGSALARGVGVPCGRSSTSDVVDAAVIISAARRNDDVLTSDPTDLARLASVTTGVGRMFGLDTPTRQLTPAGSSFYRATGRSGRQRVSRRRKRFRPRR